ncbi:SixA phosphatase family protein [Lysobacter panacisoli]|uniref:Phosphoglycerate mutase family protein n=1 Tax=Lysobacter panacisoli TaxID=1255263 RepID=A0ABP9LJP3_9GAMM|nr:phosphoglycerate mutase family protein [Lysobacter panacisoli]
MKTALTALLPLLLLGGCASTPRADADTSAQATTFVLVRHAEKVGDGSDDPALTVAGEARAQSLSREFADLPLSAVYSTAYRRTQQTAAPTARSHGLTTITYDAKQPAADFATALRRERTGQTVLIVGHSNTVPGIASALCGCEATPMTEAEYDRLTTVRIDAQGHATLRETKQQP